MSVLSRINKKIAKHGEDFLINGVTQGRGFFQVLSSGSMGMYFDSYETSAIVRPALILVTTADSPIAVSDTVTRDSRTYTVRKIVIQQLGGTAVVKIAAFS
ncbi:MAG: hypothetical protein ABFD46_09020 [Armatimonadota bacterium]